MSSEQNVWFFVVDRRLYYNRFNRDLIMKQLGFHGSCQLQGLFWLAICRSDEVTLSPSFSHFYTKARFSWHCGVGGVGEIHGQGGDAPFLNAHTNILSL